MKINGRDIATTILEDLKIRVDKLKTLGITPKLYIILLSDDPNSSSYVKQKLLKGEKIGVKITLDKEDPNIASEKLIEKIEKLNNDESIHGIIVQRPMPKHLDEEIIADTVSKEKDVDGFNKNSKFEVPVAMAILEMLKTTHSDNFNEWLKLQTIAVIGKGITAGKPIANSLLKLGVRPLIIDSKTKNIHQFLKTCDIVICAVGKENIIQGIDIKKGAILIGVGLHREVDGKFYGDFNEETIQNISSFYSPTPGGVGPVTVSMLLSNLVKATENTIDNLN